MHFDIISRLGKQATKELFNKISVDLRLPREIIILFLIIQADILSHGVNQRPKSDGGELLPTFLSNGV
jgi:hypothetical protein